MESRRGWWHTRCVIYSALSSYLLLFWRSILICPSYRVLKPNLDPEAQPASKPVCPEKIGNFATEQIFVNGTNPTWSNLECPGMSAVLLAALVLVCEILRCEWEEKCFSVFPRVLISAANEASESLSYLDLNLRPVRGTFKKTKKTSFHSLPNSLFHSLSLSFSRTHTRTPGRYRISTVNRGIEFFLDLQHSMQTCQTVSLKLIFVLLF